jgi:hypothetical protein
MSDDDVRSGLIYRFLTPGDTLERGGQVGKEEVGIDLGDGIEITASRAELLRFAREVYERFSGNAFPEGVKDPHVLVTGNPGDGFEYYGPTPGGDTDDGYEYARVRRLEEAGGEALWLFPLKPMAALWPIDGVDQPRQNRGTYVDLLDEIGDRTLDEADLSDLVYDTATVNGGGRVAQLSFLVSRLGYPAARDAVNDLLVTDNTEENSRG